MRWRHGAAALALVAALASCGGGGEGSAADEVPSDGAPSGEVAACDDLRRRENELIRAANDALAELADAPDDAARARALGRGFDRLIGFVEAQEVAAVEEELRPPLEAGIVAAAAELRSERDEVLATHGEAVSADDEHGVAGQLQTSLEKVFSLLEPPRAVYRDAGLAAATDDDPDCRFVTQRADPAG